MICDTIKITCIAVDDEPLALELIAANIADIPYLELKGKFNSSSKALSYLRENPVDLLFLDIQMPGVNGIELSQQLRFSPLIIFTTAFDHYAVESYTLNAIDYLLKPIDSGRFVQACSKVKQRLDWVSHQDLNRQITISSEYEKIYLSLMNILYIEGMKDYVKIYTTKNQKPILTRMNLKNAEEFIGSTAFIRIHKSFLVNANFIQRISSKYVMVNEYQVPLGETYKSALKLFLNQVTNTKVSM